MKQLPTNVHGHAGGNHQVAIDRTRDIGPYVAKAVASLSSAADEKLSAPLRGGYLREADELLDAIIRYANCAKTELRIAHCRDDQ